MDPIQSISCSIDLNYDVYQLYYSSGFYQLQFTISDGTWNVPYTPQDIAALGFTSTIYVKTFANLANVTSITLYNQSK